MYVKDMYVFGGTTLAEKIGSRCGAMTTTDDRRPSIDRAPQVRASQVANHLPIICKADQDQV